MFTEDVRKANHFARDIDAGTVWINSSNDEEVSVPFGGFKMSGIGRELGQSGMDVYTQIKAVHVNISKLALIVWLGILRIWQDITYTSFDLTIHDLAFKSNL